MTVEEFYQQIANIIKYEPIMHRINPDETKAISVVFRYVASTLMVNGVLTRRAEDVPETALLTGFSLGHDYALKYGRIGLEPKLIEAAQ